MTVTGELVWTVADSIGRITLNRPEFHNALSKQMWQELPRAFAAVKSGGAAVVLVSGAGSSFASGADIGELENLDSYAAAKEHWHAIRDCLHDVAGFELPTIAVINGPCLGGGLLLAIACDLRYASVNATFAVPVARLGIVLDDENIARLVSLVGPGHARELLFTAGTISSTRALEIALVNALVQPGELTGRADTAAAAIAANAQASVVEAKRSINRCLATSGSPEGQDESVVINSYLNPEFRRRVKTRGDI